MNGTSSKLKIGTCSWNYPPWVGLVYTRTCKKSADYLVEYSKKYRTAEIDSWFYLMPTAQDVLDYKAAVDQDFRFTCKVPQDITLTHLRKKGDDGQLVANPNFLSADLFGRFLQVIEPLLPQVEGIMFEFEYLNKAKMPSQSAFLSRIDEFLGKIPKGLPLAIEARNGNWLNRQHFEFLRQKGLSQVFCEKQYLPHIYDLYRDFGDLLGERVILRLMGGDRKEIEDKTAGKWNEVVDEKAHKPQILAMISDMLQKQKSVLVNVNNHFEGSAPLTIDWFASRLSGGVG